ncbi:hypothetical protein SK128_001335, partial [Halocaridina rubra]
DYTRVVLSTYPGVPGSDYINANFIRGASGSRAYIASQGPLPHTTHDFWRMVVECEVQVIIMASNETEGGKHKCECYWVNAQDEEKQFGNVSVSFVKARQVCPDFMVRTLKIKYTSDSGKTEERKICQFHYVLWPDHGVPETVRPLLDMVRLVRDCQASETLPVLVHCSAGCGRTGTICAIDYVWGLLRAGRLTENLNLFDLVKDMRRQRVAIVQTREQYMLLHRAVRELFKERLRVIDAHPYENIATDGTPLILHEKESDYEELYVKPEKQDESAKMTPPTTAPSVVSTPSGSLTRSSQIPGSNNSYLATSSPISTLDRPLSSVPPLPVKLLKPPSPSSTLLPSAGPRVSPIPQMSPILLSPNPYPSPVSFPSPSPNHCPSDTSLSSNLHYSYSTSSKVISHSASKIEKDAENAAHKMQVAQPLVHTSVLGGVAQRAVLTSSSASPQFPTNNITPSATPNSTPTPTYNMSGNAYLKPTPPTRSRTPSPRISQRKSYENCLESHSGFCENYLTDEDEAGKQVDIVRRPSIAKLKELFEKVGETETPGVRLSRSASSVTSRTSLSIHQDNENGMRVKRKSSLGAEETLQSKKAYEIIEKSRQLNVYPPSPNETIKPASTAPASVVNAAKPPSSPVYASPIVRRKANNFSSEYQEDGSTTALLARVDDRPALPVKKSKSFRYARVIDSSTNTIASTRSPELSRKKADINTYFSLDRGKVENSSLNKSESGSVTFMGDIPSPREGFKLSVYQIPKMSTNAQSTQANNENRILNCITDSRPQIPPKKVIGDRFRSTRPPESLYITTPQPFVSSASVYSSNLTPHTPQSAPPVILSDNHTSSIWNQIHRDHVDNSIYDCPKDLQANSGSDYDNLPASSNAQSDSLSLEVKEKMSTTKEQPIDIVTAKDYVNARVVRNPKSDSKDPPRYVYHPMPSKRGLRDNKVPHEYANCTVLAPASQPESVGEEPTDLYMDPHVLRKSSLGKFPLYDEVIPSSQIMSGNIIKSSSRDNMSSTSTATTPCSVTTPSSADYEVMDFGESSANVDEVFETVNYELIGAKDRKRDKSVDSKLCSEILKDICSKKDLDPIARQVYQDCQDYLLHGDNRSPVPSLLPKASDKENKRPSKLTDGEKQDTPLDITMDVDEVKCKVNVAPQGLRTRERRNSYRQAVNPINRNESKADEKYHSGIDKTKSIHKYETIWFENGKHLTRGNHASPSSHSQSHQHVSKSPSFPSEGSEGIKSLGSSTFYMQIKPPVNEDHGLNLNNKHSNKDALFKEKLEELHTLVNSLERHKPGRLSATSGFAEDDSNSRGSGSNNSTLQSRSTTSSKCSDFQEPIYANAPPFLPISRSSSSNFGQQLPPRSSKTVEYGESKSPPPTRVSKIESKIDGGDGKPAIPSPLLNGNSLYGTIATSTFRSKQHISNPSSPAFQNSHEQSTTQPPSFHSKVSTSTLPARASLTPSSPYQSIPPPKGFGSGSSPNHSPNPLQSLQLNHESRESSVSSPYYNMAAFTSGKTSQVKPMINEQDGNARNKFFTSPYSNLPSNAGFMMSNSSHKQVPKAHIVGDIAIVGDESVRLRRPGITPSVRTTEVGSGYNSSSEIAPVAPPRIKRNSSTGLPRHSAIDPPPSNSQYEWRCTSNNTEHHRQTVISGKQGWPLNDDDAPPAIPAKTAAAYQFPDSPSSPPSDTYIPEPTSHAHMPYMKPPPPKPFLPKLGVSSNHQSPTHRVPSDASSSSSSHYQSPGGASQSLIESQNHQHKALPSVVDHQKPSLLNSHHSSSLSNTACVSTKEKDDHPTTIESSSDTSDDEGVFHKFTAPNLFKKWRANTSKQSVPQSPSSPKANFSPTSSKEMKEEKNLRPKDQSKDSGVSSPTSPKPLAKAFGKLKIAANFKSYLNQRVEKAEGEHGGAANNTNDPKGDLSPSSPVISAKNIQKSASSGPNVSVFSQVVQDYKYPTPIPKKPAGPRDMPTNLRGSTPTNPQ